MDYEKTAALIAELESPYSCDTRAEEWLIWSDRMRRAIAALRSASTPPEGWKLVPINDLRKFWQQVEMVRADAECVARLCREASFSEQAKTFQRLQDSLRAALQSEPVRAMLSASPSPPEK